MSKDVHKSLTALGGRSLPQELSVHGRKYRLDRVFKNDFFAITARYEGDAGRVIVKVHRQASFLLMPLGWLGRMLARRECAAFERLADVSGVPRLIGRWGRTGVVREYIEGHALSRGEHVSDEFHSQLRELIGAIHTHDMAYVDLEKCENVLVGDDGRPYVFDFQIAWLSSPRWGGKLWPARKLLAWFQAGDRYHLGKLHRRTRPDQLTNEELVATYRRPWYVRGHRFITYPFTWGRRKVLGVLDPRRGEGERGRVDDDPVARAIDGPE